MALTSPRAIPGPLRGATALLMAAAFLMPLGTPALCAKAHEAASHHAQEMGHGTATHDLAGHDGVAPRPHHAPACEDMPGCGIVPLALLLDVHHPTPLTPDHRLADIVPAVSAAQRGVPPATPPPRA